MKKITLIASLFGSLTIFSQESKMQFTDKLVYESENEKLTTQMSISKSGILLKNNEYDLTSLYYDYEDGITYYTSIDLGNKINLNKYFSYYLFYDELYGRIQKENKISKIKNTHKQETINNNKCTVYQIEYFYKENEMPYLTQKMCIDEKNTINNVPFFLSSGSSIGDLFLEKSDNKDTSIKGLVMKFEDLDEASPLILKSTEKIDETAYFDFKKDREEVKKFAIEQKKLEEKYAEEDSDEKAEETVPYDSEQSYSIPKYESTYKKEEACCSNLAIKFLPNEKLWDGLPKYCQNIDDAMPDFENKDLKNHLKNYVGQMCDMYLTQYEYHNVAIKETLDQIRKESLYLDETRKKLNKNDTKKLDQFLKNLD